MSERGEPLDAISIRIDLSQKDTDRNALVDRLFADLTVSGSRERTWHGETFMLCASSRIKQQILSLFGANHSLQQVDQNIEQLISDHHGYLEAREDNEVVIKKGFTSVDIGAMCGLIASSLSHDLVGVVASLLKNINEILSSDQFFALCSRVDVNVFSRSTSDELLVVHVRFSSKTESMIKRIWLYKRSKKVVKINLSLRKIGISHEYLKQLEGALPSQMLSS